VQLRRSAASYARINKQSAWPLLHCSPSRHPHCMSCTCHPCSCARGGAMNELGRGKLLVKACPQVQQVQAAARALRPPHLPAPWRTPCGLSAQRAGACWRRHELLRAATELLALQGLLASAPAAQSCPAARVGSARPACCLLHGGTHGTGLPGGWLSCGQFTALNRLGTPRAAAPVKTAWTSIAGDCSCLRVRSVAQAGCTLAARALHAWLQGGSPC
jgi:hypothetical protein